MLELAELLHGLDLQHNVSTEFSALSPQSWPFSLDWLPESAFLVGGSVRDALLGRHSDYLDLDFVLPDQVVETAQAIARHYKAGFVLLDAERQIARVVFPQGTADFAQQVGPTLESDLLRRDFTVNAIAYNPQRDRFVDPLQGCVDIENRIIRMVSAENLAEDPLRLLRAYRQAAQLGFRLEARTQQAIRSMTTTLDRIAAERIQSELNYLLSSEKGTVWLTQAWQDGLLRDWLPGAGDRSFHWIAELDRIAILLQETHPDFAHGLSQSSRGAEGSPGISQEPPKASGFTRNAWMTAKLACLMPREIAAAEQQLRRLKYSRAEIQAVSVVLRCFPQLLPTSPPDAWTVDQPLLHLSLRDQYFFFQGVGMVFPAVVAMALAHGAHWEAIAPLIQRFLDPHDPVAHAIPLVTGKDVMQHLNITAGPIIGQLLSAIQLAQAEGQVHTPAEALAFATHWMESAGQNLSDYG